VKSLNIPGTMIKDAKNTRLFQYRESEDAAQADCRLEKHSATEKMLREKQKQSKINIELHGDLLEAPLLSLPAGLENRKRI
jgi:hypothetical protein